MAELYEETLQHTRLMEFKLKPVGVTTKDLIKIVIQKTEQKY